VFLGKSSSSVSRHPEKMKIKLLKKCNLCIISEINDRYENEKSTEELFNNICKEIGKTILDGGDILIPIHDYGSNFFYLIRSYI
jgi:hypothetical protein